MTTGRNGCLMDNGLAVRTGEVSPCLTVYLLGGTGSPASLAGEISPLFAVGEMWRVAVDEMLTLQPIEIQLLIKFTVNAAWVGLSH